MHNITPNKKHALVNMTLAMHSDVTDPCDIADGLNEMLRDSVSDSNLIADYIFYNSDEPKFIKASSEPEEGELFESNNIAVHPDFHLPNSNTPVVLAALRHFQLAIKAGQDLSYLSDIISPDELDHKLIDPLCESINCGVEERPENYRVVAMSTAHLTEEDTKLLTQSILDGETMVLERETGFFIKLYSDNTPENYRHGHSESIKAIIRWAIREGYQMIEFDRDAETISEFPVYDW